MEALDGARDLAPDFLWLDALVTSHGRREHLQVMSDVLAVLRQVDPQGRLRLGLVSDLAVPGDRHDTVLSRLARETRNRAFPHGFREAMRRYIDFPGTYLIHDLDLDEQVDGLAWLRGSLKRVMDRHSRHGGYLNALAFRNATESGQIHFAQKVYDNISEDLLVYPHGTEEQRKHIEAVARAQVNAFYGLDDAAPRTWSRQFWEANGQLECRRRAAV